MIYQFYYHDYQREACFDSAYYTPYCLNPEVNSDVTRALSILADDLINKQLAEYVGMLSIWLNRSCKSEWVGFTSWRQSEKTAFQFSSQNSPDLLLRNCDVVAWGHTTVLFKDVDLAPGCGLASENSHPGIMPYISRMLNEFGYEVPGTFWHTTGECYANYWAMPYQKFDEYMRWSWPLVEWGISNINEYSFTRREDRALGYVCERLFIFWRHIFEMQTSIVGPRITVEVSHASSPLRELSLALKNCRNENRRLRAENSG